MSQPWNGPLEKLDDYRWRIPKEYKEGMRVDGIIYADEKLMKSIRMDRAPEQVANAAQLPGVVKYALAMPDIHFGYGLPIGGVVAVDPEDNGVVSAGAIGYDINCGIRLLRSNLKFDEVKDKIEPLVHSLYNNVPCGLGVGGSIKVNKREMEKLVVKGAKWAVEKGYGREEDLEVCEENGAIEGAIPDKVSERALERGKGQSGTLGSGNHFLEVQVVDEIYDERIAAIFGIEKGAVTVMIHSGSRGFGYQICDDYSKGVMMKALQKYSIRVSDRQLACAPVKSAEGQNYIGAMRCAANYAWANRQILMHLCREVFERIFGASEKELGLDLIYDVAHNIGKFEDYIIDGCKRRLFVHRKGATRAFGPGNPALPLRYQEIGQPVIIPGDMGRNSYLLVGTKKAEEETFGSTCHGAGRVRSRTASIKACQGRNIAKELAEKGIVVMARGRNTLAEEAPSAYKDVSEVVNVVHNAGIAKKVCRMRPVGVVKG